MFGNNMCIFAYVSGKIQDWNCLVRGNLTFLPDLCLTPEFRITNYVGTYLKIESTLSLVLVIMFFLYFRW